MSRITHVINIVHNTFLNKKKTFVIDALENAIKIETYKI